ncbi:MAG: ankyrin repeat domain-containing protein, partial [Alphaproteobacteria bacterium]|nr:ankyrin repeat domain-containing protein [Alphaproteobacteria bacterium]
MNEIDREFIDAIGHDDFHKAKKLIRSGANINVIDANGNTELHTASYNNEIVKVEFLLNNGANPNATNNLGNSPIISAATGRFCGKEVVQELSKHGANLDYKNAKQQTALKIASSKAYNSNKARNPEMAKAIRSEK